MQRSDLYIFSRKSLGVDNRILFKIYSSRPTAFSHSFSSNQRVQTLTREVAAVQSRHAVAENTPACHLRARTGPPPAMSGFSRRTSCSELGVVLVIRAGLSFAEAGLRSRARPGTHTRSRHNPETQLIIRRDRLARRWCRSRDPCRSARGRRRTECRIRRQRSRSVPSIVDPHVIAPTCFLPHRVRGAHAQVWACVCGRSAHAKSIIPVKIDTAGATCPFWPT